MYTIQGYPEWMRVILRYFQNWRYDDICWREFLLIKEGEVYLESEIGFDIGWRKD